MLCQRAVGNCHARGALTQQRHDPINPQLHRHPHHQVEIAFPPSTTATPAQALGSGQSLQRGWASGCSNRA